jgi:hypothetical protein
MNALETYLRRATRGVWGKKRTELIAELRGSIEARIWMLECQGYAPERALEVALGEPRVIAAGLIGVHTMPKIFRSTVALGLFAALSVTLINSSRAQIEALPYNWLQVDTPSGVAITVLPEFKIFYLSFSSIKKNLEALGITVDDTPQGLNECCPNQQQLVPTLRFILPNASQAVILQTTQQFVRNANGRLEQRRSDPPKTDSSNSFVSLNDFVRQLQTYSGLPIKLLGWHNPRIVIGSTTLQIGDAKSPAQPWEVYVDRAREAANASAGYPAVDAFFSSNVQRHAVRMNDAPGSVYAVISSSINSGLQQIDAARVADDGVLYFNAVHQVLEFVKTPLELIEDRANIDKRGYGSSSRPAKALLIRITPDLKTSFVLPARVRSGALK